MSNLNTVQCLRMIAQIAAHTPTLPVTQLENSRRTRIIKHKIRCLEARCRMLACYLFTVFRCDEFSAWTDFPRVHGKFVPVSRESREAKNFPGATNFSTTPVDRTTVFQTQLDVFGSWPYR